MRVRHWWHDSAPYKCGVRAEPVNHHDRLHPRIAAGHQVGDEAVFEREIVLRHARPSQARDLNPSENVDRPQIHCSSKNSEKDRGDWARNIDPGMAAKLPSWILSANVGVCADAGRLRFDWFGHHLADADGSAAGDPDATADLFAAAFLAAFFTCESRRPWVAASRSRAI